VFGGPGSVVVVDHICALHVHDVGHQNVIPRAEKTKVGHLVDRPRDKRILVDVPLPLIGDPPGRMTKFPAGHRPGEVGVASRPVAANPAPADRSNACR